jgi:phosphoribosylformylglycinamidine synthase
LLDDWEKGATIGFKDEGEALWLVGGECMHLGQSLWLRECKRRPEGPPPTVDLAAERKAGEFVRRLISEGLVTAVHDVSDGGVLVAVAEMALAGGFGVDIEPEWVTKELRPQVVEGLRQLTLARLIFQMFGEDQGRYLVTSSHAEDYRALEAAQTAGIPCRYLGRVGGDSISIGDMPGTSGNFANIALADLRAAHESFFPKLMGADAALA